MEIPFKSLRYAPGEQVWGISVRRSVRWKNEMSYLSQVPHMGSNSPQQGLFRFSAAATLTGVAAPPESRLFELKPYGIASLKTDLDVDDPFSNRASAGIGFDTKVGVTRGLVADFTYNTDFAQVEDDEQQVNLTRFSLFFREARVLSRRAGHLRVRRVRPAPHRQPGGHSAAVFQPAYRY